MLAKDFVERLAFGAAESFLAEHVENFAECRAAALLDLPVKLDKWHAEAFGQQPARR